MSNNEKLELVEKKLINWGKDYFKCGPIDISLIDNDGYACRINVSNPSFDVEGIIGMLTSSIIGVSEQAQALKNKWIVGFNFQLALEQNIVHLRMHLVLHSMLKRK
jgi:hypothetical protein